MSIQNFPKNPKNTLIKLCDEAWHTFNSSNLVIWKVYFRTDLGTLWDGLRATALKVKIVLFTKNFLFPEKKSFSKSQNPDISELSGS